MFDPSFRLGCWYYVRSCDVAERPDEVLEVMVDYGRRIISPIAGRPYGKWTAPSPGSRRVPRRKRTYDPPNVFRLNQNIIP